MLGPFATASRFILSFTRCRYCHTPPLSHAACASMSTTTTTTTTTTRDRGDRYGPIEWAQIFSIDFWRPIITAEAFEAVDWLADLPQQTWPQAGRSSDVILLKSRAAILATAMYVGDRKTASTSLAGAAAVMRTCTTSRTSPAKTLPSPASKNGNKTSPRILSDDSSSRPAPGRSSSAAMRGRVSLDGHGAPVEPAGDTAPGPCSRPHGRPSYVGAAGLDASRERSSAAGRGGSGARPTPPPPSSDALPPSLHAADTI